MPTDPASSGSLEELAAAASAGGLEVTSAEAWGRKKSTVDGFVTELPSGNVVKMRRTLDLPVLLQTGQIPNPLAHIVQGMMQQGTSEFPKEMQDMKAVQQLMELLDSTVERCFIEPQVSRPIPKGRDPEIGPNETDEEFMARLSEWKPEAGKVSIFDIELPDKMYVFSVAQGAAADLARFRQESAAALGDVSLGEGVQDSASGTGGSVGGNREQRRAAAKTIKKSAARKSPAKRKAAAKKT